MTPKLLALGLLLASASSAAADTYVRQAGVDARHYVFRLTLLTGDSNEIHGETTATFRLVADGVREVVLDFATPTADAKGMTVAAVTSAGRPVAFTHRDSHLRLPVPGGSKAGQEVTFTITYRGVPANGLRLLDNIHGDRTAFSENWHNEARQWLPTIDHPADKATGEFIVTTRGEYQVIANGTLVEQVDLGAGAYYIEGVGADRRGSTRSGLRSSPSGIQSVRGVRSRIGSFRRTSKGSRCSNRTRQSFSAFPIARAVRVNSRTCRPAWRRDRAREQHRHSERASPPGRTSRARDRSPIVRRRRHRKRLERCLVERIKICYATLHEFASGRDAFADGLPAPHRRAPFRSNCPTRPSSTAIWRKRLSPQQPLRLREGKLDAACCDAVAPRRSGAALRKCYRRYMNAAWRRPTICG